MAFSSTRSETGSRSQAQRRGKGTHRLSDKGDFAGAPAAATIASAWSEKVAPGQLGKVTATSAVAGLLEERLHELPECGVAARAGDQDKAALLHACNSAVSVQRPVTQLPARVPASTVSACL